ncbi:STAS domain-containing protein [Microcella sp.]|uniref:STAS domain-containing protein n=1 Tax=Microcella sp. TaxID=1913979 RepID=UPI00299F83E9|nr:STAS domain-containing protein [Microcella sp.]MDX2026137.1 STAS domain-containing protein [Microcella sp.]
MQVHASTEPGLVAVAISGRFDAHGIDRFDREVIDLISAEHAHVIIDLADVEFMDSSALAGLVRALKATVAHHGSVTLVAVSDAARIILELTRLDAVFATAPSMADARARVLTAA